MGFTHVFRGQKTNQHTSNVTNEVQTIPDDSVVSGWTQIKKIAGNNGMSIPNGKKQPEYYVFKICLMLSCQFKQGPNDCLLNCSRCWLSSQMLLVLVLTLIWTNMIEFASDCELFGVEHGSSVIDLTLSEIAR